MASWLERRINLHAPGGIDESSLVSFTMSKSLRILYAAGPGNVLGTYRYWKQGLDDPTQIAMTYSGQFYDVCRELDAKAYVIATCRMPGKIKDGNFRIEHRPVPFENYNGLLYHLGQFWYGLRLLLSALRVGANVAVVCVGTHWFWLSLMRLFGIKVVPTLHCVLWQKYHWQPTAFQRFVRYLNGWFFSSGCSGIISVSADITQQVQELTTSKCAPVTTFIPQYRRASFEHIRPPDSADKVFRVLFVGRIERNKGVFDVLKMAQRLAALGEHDYEFDLCGAGSALRELKQEIERCGLASKVHCHGHCDQETMVEMYSRCHVVLVPTTTEFSEGFNKVVAEGVLAARPVITSSVCPALSLVRDSVLEVPPDDVTAYTEAIRLLRSNRELYESKRQASMQAREQFFDESRGWASALKAVLASMDGRSPESAESQVVVKTVGS